MSKGRKARVCQKGCLNVDGSKPELKGHRCPHHPRNVQLLNANNDPPSAPSPTANQTAGQLIPGSQGTPPPSPPPPMPTPAPAAPVTPLSGGQSSSFEEVTWPLPSNLLSPTSLNTLFDDFLARTAPKEVHGDTEHAFHNAPPLLDTQQLPNHQQPFNLFQFPADFGMDFNISGDVNMEGLLGLGGGVSFEGSALGDGHGGADPLSQVNNMPVLSMSDTNMFSLAGSSSAKITEGTLMAPHDAAAASLDISVATSPASSRSPSPPSSTDGDIEPNSADTDEDEDTINANGKRPRSPDEFIVNDRLRCKRYSDRAASLIKNVKALSKLCDPFIFIYVARPESIRHVNGRARSFISPKLRAALKAEYRDADELVDKVHGLALMSVSKQWSPPEVAALNKQVSSELAARKEAEREVEAMHAKNKALEKELAKFREARL